MERFFYFAQVVDGIRGVALFALVGFGLATLVFFVKYFMEYGEEEDDERKIRRNTVICTLVAALILVFTPSKTTLLYMAGGKIAEDFIESNEKVKEIPDKTVELIYNELVKAIDKQAEKDAE